MYTCLQSDLSVHYKISSKVLVSWNDPQDIWHDFLNKLIMKKRPSDSGRLKEAKVLAQLSAMCDWGKRP